MDKTKTIRNGVLLPVVFGIILTAGAFAGSGCPQTGQKAIQKQQEYGSIAGRAVNEMGDPMPGLTVTLHGTKLSSITDDEGRYKIEHVPVSAPRYIIATTEQNGYFPGQAGNIAVNSANATTVNLAPERVTPRKVRLHHQQTIKVKMCYLVEIKQAEQWPVLNSDAIIAPSLYPEKVKPYLMPGKYIESDDPSISQLAKQLTSNLPPWDRNKQSKVVRAIHDWVVKNIEDDSMKNFPGDVTCGEYQIKFGGWGQNFNEWCYTAKEVMEQRRAVPIEYERLVIALLRAAGIPARPAFIQSQPVTQWWLQLPDGTGYWASMETSAGNLSSKENSSSRAKFPTQPSSNVTLYALNQDAVAYMDWFINNSCIWYEDFGEKNLYALSSDGLEGAKRDMEVFTREGKIPPRPNAPQMQGAGLGPHYELYSRGFTIDLANVGEQGILEVEFPLLTGNEHHQLTDKAHWTSHANWLDWNGTDTVQDATTGNEISFYKLVFSLCPPG